jgi:hypothetical protein
MAAQRSPAVRPSWSAGSAEARGSCARLSPPKHAAKGRHEAMAKKKSKKKTKKGKKKK